jgi:hypothetical protein
VTKIPLNLEPAQLAGVIEAVHDAILRRVRWSTVEASQYQTWRRLDIETVQVVIGNLKGAYAEALMVYQEADFMKSPEFATTFMLPDEVWDLLDTILHAESWEEVPTHPIHSIADNCPVCGAISKVA